MSSARNFILVGLVVLFGAGFIIWFSANMEGRKFGRGETYQVKIQFDDASGLARRSRAVIAGVDIGKVEKIELVHGKAVITMSVSNEIALHEDASVMKKSTSLLGDSELDVDPGTETLPRIPDGGWIKNVKSAPGMDEILASVQRVANNTEKITGSLAGSVGTDQGKQDISHILSDLRETSSAVNRASALSAQQIARILANIEVLTSRISRIEPSQEQQVVAILANVRQITEQTKQALGAVNNVINAQQGQVGAAMEQVREALRKLDATLASAENISKNIEQGNGVVGKLLTDKDLADRVSHSLTGVTSYIDRLTGLQIEAGMRASIGLQPLGHGRFAYPSIAQVDAKIIPANSSRYIGVSVVSDSQGNYQHAVTSQQINGEPLTTLTDTYTETLRVSAYLAQMLGPVTFRAGLIESTGGVGVDWDIIPNTLSLHADAFDFTPPVPNVWPTLRVYGQYTFAKHFDLYAGGDDLINNPFPNPDPSKVLTSYGRYAFAGVGFHFTDDDLKAILSLTGVPK